MTGTDLVEVVDIDLELTALARRHKGAGGLGLQVLNFVGGQAENLLERLPDRVKDRLEDATARALNVAMRAASQSRGLVPDQKGWLNTAMTTAMGAMGGAGGLPTALAELPVTTTVLLRTIQGIAFQHGFNPDDPDVQKECLLVFGSAGPLAADDGADMAFLSARVTLTGGTVHGLIARVAPRLATVLGQKLATQTIPVIGAVAGAATNYAYTSYYQEMAHVHFGLRRLSEKSGRTRAELVEDLRGAINAL
ncbi:EcsC family protein [Puniceibacterium sediminis]|uniref:EcsC protein family protein n=1 Tax=Puniceibacterium sediminis TaxID=1608407 RepID=A0A238WWY4_9RHOB|nr:EcsC family protein [Puniceibacterium sediminis]SNR51047.1 EcsC protein family protein [Puniceibacterium sediminis]